MSKQLVLQRANELRITRDIVSRISKVFYVVVFLSLQAIGTDAI